MTEEDKLWAAASVCARRRPQGLTSQTQRVDPARVTSVLALASGKMGGEFRVAVLSGSHLTTAWSTTRKVKYNLYISVFTSGPCLRSFPVENINPQRPVYHPMPPRFYPLQLSDRSTGSDFELVPLLHRSADLSRGLSHWQFRIFGPQVCSDLPISLQQHTPEWSAYDVVSLSDRHCAHR